MEMDKALERLGLKTTEEIKDFIISNRIKTRLLNEWRRSKRTLICSQPELIMIELWRRLIWYSLFWTKTKEGPYYWMIISQMQEAIRDKPEIKYLRGIKLFKATEQYIEEKTGFSAEEIKLILSNETAEFIVSDIKYEIETIIGGTKKDSLIAKEDMRRLIDKRKSKQPKL